MTEVDENGIESKRYNAKDGVGIYELLKKNIIIGIISHSEKGDGIISRANYLGIQYCYVGNDPKDKIATMYKNNLYGNAGCEDFHRRVMNN